MSHPAERLLAMVPEFEDDYPVTLVLDLFADKVAAALREHPESDLPERGFAAVETLAASGEPRLRNAVTVSFLEAAPWGKLGAAHLLGPRTRELLHAADPRMIDPALLRDA